MPLPDQQDILSGWEANAACLVSIACTTFNQRKYIRDALKGFLLQNTRFPFEIVVHDDASTDGTREIIEEYATLYPRIIKPVLQEENQYSKGGFKPLFHAMRYATGEYVAVCEGDDYWIDKNKLQIQADSLNAHPQLDFCFHPAYCSRDGKLSTMPNWDYGKPKILHVRDVLRSADGTFAPTSSYMFRRDIVRQFPQWFYDVAPVGDFFIEMYGSRRGGALYLPRPMSVYREISAGSWHANTYGNDARFQHYSDAMIEAVDLLQREFSSDAESFSWKRAWLYTFYAQHYLYRRNYGDFSDVIAKAVREYRFMSRKQATMYRLRRYPRLARLVVLQLRRALALLSRWRHRLSA